MTKRKIKYAEHDCPHCGKKYGGSMGKHNLKVHILLKHPNEHKETIGEASDKIEENIKAVEQPPVQTPALAPVPVQAPGQPPAPIQTSTPAPTSAPIQTQAQPPVQAPVPEFPAKMMAVDGSTPSSQPRLRPLPQYEEPLEPEAWLRQFLASYGISEGFVAIQCDILRARNELPSAAQLADDLGTMTSNIKKGKHAAYIAEIYGIELRKYLEQRRLIDERMARERGGHGYGVDRRPSMYDRQGIPLYDNRPQPGYIDPYRQQQPPPRDPYQRDPYYPQPYYDPLREMSAKLTRLEEENRRHQEERYQNLVMQIQNKGQSDPEVQQLRNLVEQMNQERLRKQDEDMQVLKMQIQQKGQGLTYQDVQNAIAQERAKITYEDIDGRIRTALAEQGRLSETDVKMKEVTSKHDLEMEKLVESGKTREAIAGAVQTGLASVGEAIARTAQEVGTQKEVPLHGETAGQKMWKTTCPACHGPITAPLSAKLIRCPTCGGQFEVLPPEQKPPAGMPPQPPPSTPEASFSVEQPPPQTPNAPSMPIDRTAEPVKETPLTPEIGLEGNCANCGMPLFHHNIAATEEGKTYCKDCWAQHGNS